MDQPDTLRKIHTAAMSEFLKNGFRKTSLRKIVKDAGVTTGAFYGYYASKEALFDALVGECFHTMLDHYQRVQQEFAELPAELQPEQMGVVSGECMDWMLRYAYDNLDVFKLIMTGAEGTSYAHLVDEMVRIEEEATDRYKDVMIELDYPAPVVNASLQHILITGMFSAFTELILHDKPLEEALEYLAQLRRFYTAGWQKLLGEAIMM
ncbi:MAG: TetR/AcrR family transcriptional regulator [Eubacterium sp.]|nr:TetR/AcrR family transcriptional regulator [Eubacterium sp.]